MIYRFAEEDFDNIPKLIILNQIFGERAILEMFDDGAGMSEDKLQ